MHFSLYSLTYISYTMRSTRTLWRFYWIRCHSCIRSSFIDPYTSFLVCLCTWFLYITSSLFKSILVCAPWHLKPFIQEIVEIDKWFLAAKLDFQRLNWTFNVHLMVFFSGLWVFRNESRRQSPSFSHKHGPNFVETFFSWKPLFFSFYHNF